MDIVFCAILPDGSEVFANQKYEQEVHEGIIEKDLDEWVEKGFPEVKEKSWHRARLI